MATLFLFFGFLGSLIDSQAGWKPVGPVVHDLVSGLRVAILYPPFQNFRVMESSKL